MEIGDTISSRVMVSVLNILGIWPPPESIIYKICSIIFHLLFAYGYTLFLCINLVFLADITDLTDSLFMTLTCFGLCSKLTNFRYFMNDIQYTLQRIKTFQLHNDNENEFIRMKVKFYDRILFAYYIVSNLAGFAAYTYVLFDYNGVGNRALPFHGWYPIDWRGNIRNYWIVYGYQVGGMMCLCNLNITMDLYPCYVMYMIGLQMEILGKRLENIGKNTNGANGKENEMEKFNSSVQENESKILRNCVKFHQDLIG